MLFLVSIIHFIVSIVLLIAVLATDSKAGFRSFSSGTSANESSFLKSSIDKFTVKFLSILGVIFFCTSISMSYFSKIDSEKHSKALSKSNDIEFSIKENKVKNNESIENKIKNNNDSIENSKKSEEKSNN